jgi:hypothetical protein
LCLLKPNVPGYSTESKNKDLCPIDFSTIWV